MCAGGGGGGEVRMQPCKLIAAIRSVAVKYVFSGSSAAFIHFNQMIKYNNCMSRSILSVGWKYALP